MHLHKLSVKRKYTKGAPRVAHKMVDLHLAPDPTFPPNAHAAFGAHCFTGLGHIFLPIGAMDGF